MSMFAPNLVYQGLQILIPHPYRICQVCFQVIDRAFAFCFCLPVSPVRPKRQREIDMTEGSFSLCTSSYKSCHPSWNWKKKMMRVIKSHHCTFANTRSSSYSCILCTTNTPLWEWRSKRKPWKTLDRYFLSERKMIYRSRSRHFLLIVKTCKNYFNLSKCPREWSHRCISDGLVENVD